LSHQLETSLLAISTALLHNLASKLMATDVILDTKLRLGSAWTQSGQSVEIPIELIELDPRVTGLGAFDIKINYNADQLNLLDQDGVQQELSAETPVLFTLANQDAFILGDSYVIEEEGVGTIQLSTQLREELKTTGAVVNPSAVSAEAPLSLGNLSIRIPETIAFSARRFDLTTSPQAALLSGFWSDGNEDVVAFTTSETENGLIEIDDSPKFSSNQTVKIDEGIGSDQPVYTIVVTDDSGTITFSLDPASGPLYFKDEFPTQDGNTYTQIIYLRDNPDYETKTSYAVSISARDRRNETEQDVLIEINDVDDESPIIGSSETNFSILESQPEGYQFHTVKAEDNSGEVLFELAGADAGLFSISNTTGVLTINQAFDFEDPLNGRDNNAYTITVVAYDRADPRNQTSQDLTISILDVDEDPPVFAEGSNVELAVNENIGANQEIYRPSVTDQSSLKFQLIGDQDDDADQLEIDSSTGAVTLRNNPNYEAKTLYQFTISVEDALELTATQDVELAIVDLDEPAIFKGKSLVFGLVTEENDVIFDSSFLDSGITSLFDDDPDGALRQISLVVDRDQNEWSDTLASDFGTITMPSDTGNWQYIPNGTVDQRDFFDVVAVDFKGGLTFETIELVLYSLAEGENFSTRFEGSSEIEAVEDQPSSGTLEIIDLEGIQSIELLQSSDPAAQTYAVARHGRPNLSVTLTSGEQRAQVSWTYEPYLDFVGSDSFTLVAIDKQNQKIYQTIALQINNVDDPAQVISGNIGVGIQGAVIAEQLVATDADGPLSYAISAPPGSGEVSITAEGLWTYVPNDSSVEQDSFTILLTDALGGTTNAPISIDFAAAPEPNPPENQNPGPINNAPPQGSGSSPTIPAITGTFTPPIPANAPPAVFTPAVGNRVQSVDADNDGLLEVETTPTGETIDGNADGIPDFQQPQVAGFRLVNTGASRTHFGALAVPQGLRLSFKADPLIEPASDGRYNLLLPDGASISAALPQGISNNFAGVVAFDVTNLNPGDLTTVSLSLPKADEFATFTDATNHAYLKFNYLNGRLEEFVDVNGTPLYNLVDRDGDGVLDTVDLQLVDGDLQWDGDGLTNGTVVDPGTLVSAPRVFSGGRQRDRLMGNLLANTMVGRASNDLLIGNLGRDVLKGGTGDDRLDGGEDADLLIGGGGRDLYIYRSLQDSTLSQSDTIRGLSAKDRFDFRRFESEARLQFIGNDSFSSTAGELRVTMTSLQADLNGDGAADFRILFANKFHFDADQLLL